MSLQALNWAYGQAVTPSAAKFVLITLANYADEAGCCYPSQRKLAEDTGQSERSVRTHLATLEQQGRITRDQRRRKNGSRTSDTFHLNWQDGNRKISPVVAQPTGKSRRTPRQISPDLPAKSAGPIDEPSLNHQRNLKRAREERAAAFAKARELWDTNKIGIQGALGTKDFSAWIEKLEPVSDDGFVLTLAAPTETWREYVSDHFVKSMQLQTGRTLRIVVRRVSNRHAA